MRGLPLYVTLVDSEFVLLCLVVENQTVVFMGQAVYVLVQQELGNVVFLAVQSEEVFYL